MTRLPESPFATVDDAALADVSGGLITPKQNLDPVLLQGIQALSQAIVQVGQSLAGAKQASSQGMMQMVQQMMQAKSGH
jgi:hypothetical protein